MKIELEPSLDRWVEAQILDREQAGLIRQFEAGQAPQRRARWPVVMAVAFGGIMLAAGVLLFVSAHWDYLSPFARMTLLVAAVGALHAAGAFSSPRFRTAGVTLHAAGTVALGGAIAMAGQIFNMQEHWPAAVLLWAAGAAAAWLLLGDWPQLALAAVLVPWWLAGEWTEAVPQTRDSWPALTCGILLAALCYLTVRAPGAAGCNDPIRAALTWIGGIALLPAALAAALDRRMYAGSAPPGPALLLAGWACALLLPLAFAYAFRRNAAWMNAVAALWVIGLNFLAQARLDVPLYGWYALGSAGLIAWGIYEFRPERINLGMAGFALTIVFFFFSSVMDKLGRSASLIALGVLFVAGGWYWEKLRRRLVAQVVPGGAL